jgi:hypothetical protein
MPIQKLTDTFENSRTCAFAPDVYITVIRVTHKSMSSALQFPIKGVEQQVGQ